jgi:TolB-like protein/tetratricopeptide (TPR) repeat protein
MISRASEAMTDDATRTEPKPPPVDRMSLLWQRINEHKIVQWSVAYVALAYAIQHAVVLTQEAFHWPENILRIPMLLLALGLPIVVTLAWYHGERASRQFSKAELSILSVLLVIGAFLFYAFAKPSEEHVASATAPAKEAGVAAARTAAADPHGTISVAVLPFVNLSSDKEQEFFSDGMTEEITTALAKVPDLRVVARTSAFEFKGKNVNIKTMGDELGATHLIEGSVRKAGNRVRITAQLIKADDGTHIWAEDYDRELTDVFAIQEDIARAITASLHMTLGLKPGENLVNNRAIDSDSYGKMLRAGAILVARGGEPTVAQELRNSSEALALLEDVVAKNPNYAPAWLLLANGYQVQMNNSTRPGVPVAEARAIVNELRSKKEAAVQRAIQLDPNLPGGYNALAYTARSRGKPIEAEELINKSLQLDPFNSYTLFTAGMIYSSAGRVQEGLAFYEKGHAVDPFYPNLAFETAQDRWVTQQYDAAIALAKTLRPNNRAPMLSLIYTSLGRFRDAADALMEAAASDSNSNPAKLAPLLRMLPQKNVVAAEIPFPGFVGPLAIYLGVPERALTDYERVVEIGHVLGNKAFVWHPVYAPLRKTERFKTLMRKAGLVDYWRAKGWPAQCHPTTGDDFVCE